MSKLAEMIVEGKIDAQDLIEARELIERAEFVEKALAAVKKTLLFKIGENEISCYSYTDRAGEYESWGKCNRDGIFISGCNWGGHHETGRCDLTSYKDVFLALDKEEFKYDLERFLKQQIAKAENC